MRRNDSGTLVCLAVALCLGLLASGVVHAQAANPELGETGGSVGGGAHAGGAVKGTWQPPTGTQNEAANGAVTPAAAPEPASNAGVGGTTGPTPEMAPTGTTDHAAVVHRWGVGFFGVLGVPAMGCNAAGGPVGTCPAGGLDLNGTVSAPTIGVRYWLEDGLGIELALGLGVHSAGSTTTVTGSTASPETNAPSMFALALHGGVPLVFAQSKHFAFEVVPELNFGVASGSWTSPANAKINLSGLLFQVGGRIGTEIQFGFMDLPQLALQASVGLMLSVENRGASASNAPAAGTTDVSSSAFNFGTTVNGAPWDIFKGNVAAIYYF